MNIYLNNFCLSLKIIDTAFGSHTPTLEADKLSEAIDGQRILSDDHIYFDSGVLPDFIQQVQVCSARGSLTLWFHDKEQMAEFTAMYFSLFKQIFAAGGWVTQRQHNETKLLIIKRLDVWDLPKGKIEPGESSEKAAIREVQEETGLKDVKIVKPLSDTYHIYSHKERWVMKTTYWYEMVSRTDSPLVAQAEEDITEVKWAGLAMVKEAIKGTYLSLRPLFQLYIDEYPQ